MCVGSVCTLHPIMIKNPPDELRAVTIVSLRAGEDKMFRLVIEVISCWIVNNEYSSRHLTPDIWATEDSED